MKKEYQGLEMTQLGISLEESLLVVGSPIEKIDEAKVEVDEYVTIESTVTFD